MKNKAILVLQFNKVSPIFNIDYRLNIYITEIIIYKLQYLAAIRRFLLLI